VSIKLFFWVCAFLTRSRRCQYYYTNTLCNYCYLLSIYLCGLSNGAMNGLYQKKVRFILLYFLSSQANYLSSWPASYNPFSRLPHVDGRWQLPKERPQHAYIDSRNVSYHSAAPHALGRSRAFLYAGGGIKGLSGHSGQGTERLGSGRPSSSRPAEAATNLSKGGLQAKVLPLQGQLDHMGDSLD
jgi:hypothetical protein